MAVLVVLSSFASDYLTGLESEIFIIKLLTLRRTLEIQIERYNDS